MKKKSMLLVVLLIVLAVGWYTLRYKKYEVELLSPQMRSAEYPIPSHFAGKVGAVFVKPGDLVQKDAPLLVFDTAEIQQGLYAAQAELVEVAKTIPATEIPLLDGQTLGQKLEQQRNKENSLRELLEAISVELARADIEAMRVTSLYFQNKATEQEQQETLAKRAAIRDMQGRTRAEHAQASKERSFTDMLIREAGTSEPSPLPIEERKAHYLALLTKVHGASAYLQNSLLRAPAEAEVLNVLVKQGDHLSLGQSTIIIKEKQAPQVLVGHIKDEQASDLRTGAACIVEFADGTTAEGKVVAFGNTAVSGSFLQNSNSRNFLNNTNDLPTSESNLVPVEVEVFMLAPAGTPFAPVVKARVQLDAEM